MLRQSMAFGVPALLLACVACTGAQTRPDGSGSSTAQGEPAQQGQQSPSDAPKTDEQQGPPPRPGEGMRPVVGPVPPQPAPGTAQQQAEADSLRASARAVDSASDADRAAKLNDFIGHLEQAPSQAVARLVADHDRKSPAWAPAAVKLARIQVHLGDRTHALPMLEDVISQGGSGPMIDAAQQLRDELKRTSNVKPNLIGVVLPLSGKFKAFAESMLDAISMQIDLQNRGPVQVVVKDSKNEPDGAQQAVEELAKEGVIAILGPIGLSEGTAAAVRAQQLGIPIISLARAEGLTQLGPYVFRNMTTSSQQARAVAKFAMEKLQAKGFAILQPESPGGEDLSRFFWDAVVANGGEIRGHEHYPDRSTNFKKTVQKLVGRDNLAERKEFVEEEARIVQEIQDPYKRRKELARLRNSAAPIIDFDALFIPDFASAVRLMAPAIAAEDIITNGCDQKDIEVIKKTTKREDVRPVQLLGWMGWDSAELVDERTGAARYVQCSVFVDAFFAKSERAATRRFVESFDTAFKRPPLQLEAHAHDAAGVLKSVIVAERPSTREQLRDALSSMKKPFEGATGDIVFGKDREADKQLFWLWINRGQIIEFDPNSNPPVPMAWSAIAAQEAEKNKDKAAPQEPRR